jgi:hypothetical protein
MQNVREIMRMANADAPPAPYGADDIVAAGRRRGHRALAQRLGGASVVAAAVATAAVLTTVNLAVTGDRGTPAPVPPAASPPTPTPTAPAPSPPFTFTFAGYQVDSYRVLAPDEVTPVYQSAGVVRDGAAGAESQYVGTLTVYQPRAFDPGPVRTGTRTTVQGREAYQVAAGGGREVVGVDSWSTEVTQSGTATRTTLAWQYAAESWAVLTSEESAEGTNQFPFADEVRVAERFTVGTGQPAAARVPFRTGYLPDGFVLRAVSGQSLTAEQRGMVTFIYAKPPDPTAPPAGTGDPAKDGTAVSVEISILWVDAPPPDAVKRKSRCNPGQHWCSTTLPGGEFWFLVTDPSKTLPDEELLKIADNLTFATIKDSATWYPVT